MNLLEARVTLRPRSVSDVLDLALPFCLLNRRTLAPLTLAVMGPVAVLVAYLRLAHEWPWPRLWLLMAGLCFLLEGIFTIAAGDLLFQPTGAVRIRGVVGRFVRRLPSYAVLELLHGLIIGASAFTVVLVLFEAPVFLFVREASLLEGASPLGAGKRSRALVRGRGVAGFAVWFTALALPFAGAVAVDILGNAVVGFVLQLGQPFGDLWSEGGSGFAVVGALLAIPVAAAARFLAYTDARTRKEGWDIQLRFMAIAEEDAARRRQAA
jgi:hypothetical protein